MKFPSHLNCDGKIVSEMGPWNTLTIVVDRSTDRQRKHDRKIDKYRDRQVDRDKKINRQQRRWLPKFAVGGGKEWPKSLKLINEYIYIYICMYICVCVCVFGISNLTIYHSISSTFSRFIYIHKNVTRICVPYLRIRTLCLVSIQ